MTLERSGFSFRLRHEVMNPNKVLFFFEGGSKLPSIQTWIGLTLSIAAFNDTFDHSVKTLSLQQ